ncbi:hypothetical protein D3C72_1312420 [compost metagenome]
MRGQVAGTEVAIQAERSRHLVEHGAAQVGTFGDIQPAQRGRQRQVIPECGDVLARQHLFQVLQVAAHLLQATAFSQVRQQCVQRRAGIQRVDAAVEAVLHAQEASEIVAVGKDVAGHDALVEGTMAVAGGGLKPHAAAVFEGCLNGHRECQGKRPPVDDPGEGSPNPACVDNAGSFPLPGPHR